jgi:hypothetical protein
MAKYLFLKHYRGAPASVNNVPMDQWTPDEIDAHIQYMEDFAARLRDSGEYVDSQALASEGAWVRYDGEGKPPVTDGPFAETKEQLLGFYVIEAKNLDDALDVARDLGKANPGGAYEIRPVGYFTPGSAPK